MENPQEKDDEIVTFCADDEVIWRSEIEAIMAGKPIGKTPSQKIPKCKTADSAEKDGD